MFLDHETILTGDLVHGFELSCILFCWADVYLYRHCYRPLNLHEGLFLPLLHGFCSELDGAIAFSSSSSPAHRSISDQHSLSYQLCFPIKIKPASAKFNEHVRHVENVWQGSSLGQCSHGTIQYPSLPNQICFKTSSLLLTHISKQLMNHSSCSI